MPIAVQCGRCGKRMAVPERMAGKRGKCPGCAAAVEVPAVAPKASAPAQGAPPVLSPPRCRDHAAPPAGRCNGCGGPICKACIQAHGYFCSSACKEKGKAKRAAMSSAEARSGKAAVIVRTDATLAKIKKGGIAAAVLLALLLVGAFFLRGGSRFQWEAFPGPPISQVMAGRDAVYTLAEGGKVSALAVRDGKTLWSVEAALPREQEGVGEEDLADRWREISMRLAGDRLLCLGDSGIVALDAGNGKVLWKHAGGRLTGDAWEEDDPSFAAGDGALVAIAPEGRPFALDLASGQERWRAPEGTRARGVACAPGRVYVLACAEGGVACLSPQDGSVRWTWSLPGSSGREPPEPPAPVAGLPSEEGPLPEPPEAGAGPGEGEGWVGAQVDSLLPVGDRVVAVSGAKAFCLEGGGKPAWVYEAEGVRFHRLSAACVGEGVFFSSENEAALVEAASGKALWRKGLGSSPRLAAFDGKRLLLNCGAGGAPSVEVKSEAGYAQGLLKGFAMGSGLTLLCVGSGDGRLLWSLPHLGGATLLADGRVYVVGHETKVRLLDATPAGLFKGQAYALGVDPEDGRILWKWSRDDTRVLGMSVGRSLVLAGCGPRERDDPSPGAWVTGLKR